MVVASALAAAGKGFDPTRLPAPAQKKVEFARDVRSIFAAKCFACHAGEQREGGLRLDRRANALTGGDSGPLLAAGKSAESRLIRYVSGLDADHVMPPAGPRLTAAQVAVLRAWIDQGAVWPEENVGSGGSQHWAFKPVVRPPVPQVNGRAWVRNPIDAFILAELEKRRIRPSPEADRVTLIRRASLDLTGLPPTPEEVDAFLGDRAPNAYEKVVDRLLASPHYGERWGRHWLDQARYADSNGYTIDSARQTWL